MFQESEVDNDGMIARGGRVFFWLPPRATGTFVAELDILWYKCHIIENEQA
jgi:hypothetical protein